MEPLQQRKSHTSIGEIYFWTATIHKWTHLLDSDLNKQLIVDYLKKLSDEGLITVYAFAPKAFGVPNHIHLIWQQNKLNGKETLKGSLLKYTGHELLKLLKAEGKSNLYEVNVFFRLSKCTIPFPHDPIHKKLASDESGKICIAWKGSLLPESLFSKISCDLSAGL